MQTFHSHPTVYRCMLLLLLTFAVLVSPPLSAAARAATSGYTLLDPDISRIPAVDAKAFVLYDAQSGTFLTGKDQDRSLSPASVTKVMTVLLAMENLQLTDQITITREMFETIPNDYTRLGLMEGEIITVEQALYASLLISANDASMALASAVGGTIDNFVSMMNTRAAELGCLSTHFTNPYGLADEDHLTTAHDIALIFAEVLKHELYTRIATTRHYLMPATNIFADERGMQNGNKFVATEQFKYDGYIGGKTGFTELSSYTITAGASRDGRTLIAVILGASQSASRYLGCMTLFDYGFENFCTKAVDPVAFQAVQDQTVASVTTAIEQAGSALVIDDVNLQLDDFYTTTAAKAESEHRCIVDDSIKPLLETGLDSQILSYPLYLLFADGTRYPVGQLDISIGMAPTQATTTETSTGPRTSAWRVVLRIVATILLVLVIAFCLLVLFAMIRHDLQKKRRRKITGRK